jgi:ATP-dependent RNA helicase DeaD
MCAKSASLRAQMQTFKELALAPQLDKALVAKNFTTPTPIQAQAIPPAMEGRDLIACAQTGTGKTAAFAIPILSKIYAEKDSTALVLVPTRELAVQVTLVFRELSLFMPHVRTVDLIGGVAMQPQLRAIAKGFRIIIATPGRLVDHLERGSVKLNTLAVLTLDEADRMLDMGFAPQLRQIFRYLPKSHQTLLFSATLPPNIQEITKNILKNPVEVKVGAVSTPIEKIEQSHRSVNGEAKNAALIEEINSREGSMLIFARTQKRTDRLARYLQAQNIPAGLIHGGRSQNQRNRAIDEFKDGTTRILVATDIAARGIDIDHVAHVINYDLPQVPEDYIHRIGRTARAGRTGKALSLISHEERPLWRDIEKLLRGKGASSGATAANGSKPIQLKTSPEDRAEDAKKRAHRKGPPSRGRTEGAPARSAGSTGFGFAREESGGRSIHRTSGPKGREERIYGAPVEKAARVHGVRAEGNVVPVKNTDHNESPRPRREREISNRDVRAFSRDTRNKSRMPDANDSFGRDLGGATITMNGARKTDASAKPQGIKPFAAKAPGGYKGRKPSGSVGSGSGRAVPLSPKFKARSQR